ncbi:MAG TPA: glycosyltransferase family 4 protein [Thermoanaerobaculia bacterium]|nr:glycosyltransferase family 4 protein [Thermoanaerobaculia bacterium]
MRKRVMLLVETFSMPSAQSAAVQYRDCFRDAGYDAIYVARDEPQGFESVDRLANLAWRARMRRRSRAMKADIQKRWDDRIVAIAAECDVVYAAKVASLELHQRIQALKKPRLLVLFADALWLPFARGRGWQDVDAILSIADGIVTVNEMTANYARQKNERVFIVNDSPQTEEFDKVRERYGKDPSRTVLGWIGSPFTATSLFKIWEPLERLFAEDASLHLRLVGTGSATLLNVPRFEKVRWSAVEQYDQATMIREALAMDIGLFPLFSGEDALARGAHKAAIYMSGEAAVAAQRYGEAAEVIEDGVTGMLCATDEEWYEKLAFLIRNADERRAMAKRGLAMVRERFSRARTFEQLRAAIESV